MCGLGGNLWDSDFLTIARQSAQHVLADLGRRAPGLAERKLNWIALRSDISQPEAYFTHPESLPLLALPWWLEKSIRGAVDLSFQADVMYSSISAYYFTRMLDDLMDGHEIDRACLPALYAFHSQFQQTYFPWFPPDHAFWSEFEVNLLATAEAASGDFTLNDVIEADFVRYSARKSAAAAIPLAAVCHRYGRTDLLPLWLEFFSIFGCWNQMRDDVLDWSQDYNAGTKTWMLCEAERKRSRDESVPLWIGRSGLLWASNIMDGWIKQMTTAAISLRSTELSVYLELRRSSFHRQIQGMISTAAIYERLLELDSSPQPS